MHPRMTNIGQTAHDASKHSFASRVRLRSSTNTQGLPHQLARVIKAGLCIEASFKRGKGEVGMDEYQIRTWEGWHHHMSLSLTSMWFLIGETHRGQQLTPALTLPQVRYGLNILLMEVFLTISVSSICRHVQRQLMRNELARFYHHRTRNCLPPRKLRRDIQ
jgi:hypothetical protein